MRPAKTPTFIAMVMLMPPRMVVAQVVDVRAVGRTAARDRIYTRGWRYGRSVRSRRPVPSSSGTVRKNCWPRVKTVVARFLHLRQRGALLLRPQLLQCRPDGTIAELALFGRFLPIGRFGFRIRRRLVRIAIYVPIDYGPR